MTRVLVFAHNHPALHPGGTEIVAHDLFSGVGQEAADGGVCHGCLANVVKDDDAIGGGIKDRLGLTKRLGQFSGTVTDAIFQFHVEDAQVADGAFHGVGCKPGHQTNCKKDDYSD